MVKKTISISVLVALVISTLPAEAMAREFKSYSGVKTSRRQYQVRKARTFDGASVSQDNFSKSREGLRKKNQLSKAEKRQLTPEEIRDFNQARIVVLEEEKKPDPKPEDEKKPEDKGNQPTHDHIIDDGDKGFNTTGKWKVFPEFTEMGYEKDMLYSKQNKSKATWNFRSLKKGMYDVFVHWTPFVGLTDNAQYTIKSNGKLLSTVTADQRETPEDKFEEGVWWKFLDTVKIKKKKNLKVILKHNAKEYVVADAAMILPEDTTPPPPETPCGDLVDNAAIQAFINAGYITTEDNCAGNARRDVTVRLDVELNGGILSTPPATPSFDDLPTTDAYYGHFEEAAKEGWITGDNDCYGSHPCTVRPREDMTTAEFADLAVKSFGLQGTGAAPQFVDNPSGQSYTAAIQAAADYCVLLPHPETGRIYPEEPFSFVEAINRFHRIDQGLEYGKDCGQIQADAGDLYVNLNPTPVPERQVLGGTLAEPVMIVDFNAKKEAIDVTTLRFELNGQDDGNESIDRVELYKATSNAPFAIATIAACLDVDTHMCATIPAGELRILKDQTETILVRPRMKSDVQGGVSDMQIVLTLDNDLEGEPDVAVEAVGVDSGKRLTQNDQDDIAEGEVFLGAVAGEPNKDLHSTDALTILSKIVSITNANPDPNSTAVPAGIAPVGQFKFTAAEHNNTKDGLNDVVLDELMFSVLGKNIQFDSAGFNFYNKADQTQKVNCTPMDENGNTPGATLTADNFFVSCTGLDASIVQTDIDEGDAETFVLEANIVNPQVSSSFEPMLQVSFENFTDGSPNFFGLEGTHIRWHDKDAGDTARFFWIEYPETVVRSTAYGEPPVTTTSFILGVDGPNTSDFTRDDNDAVLANVKMEARGGKVDVKDLFIAVEGETVLGQSFASSNVQIAQVMEDVEIRNKQTGRTIDGVRLTNAGAFGHNVAGDNRGTYQIYRFDDFIVHGDNEEWEFRVDFIDNGAGVHPKNGDKFRMHICAEPTHIYSANVLIPNGNGCTFGDLINENLAYQMETRDLSSGDHVGIHVPRGTVSGNFHRIALATLTIAQKDIGTTDVTVENAQDVNLLRFEARAGEAEDILATVAIFAAEQGSLRNAQNYALWVDTNGDSTVDTILEDGVADQNNLVIFSDWAGGGYVIPKEETVVFEVHADIASSLTSDTLQLKFAYDSDLGVEPSYIQAEELDDGSILSGIKTNEADCPTAECTIFVSTTESVVYELANQGDLFVTQDTTPIRSRQYLGGTLGEAGLRLEFLAEKEAIDVTDLQFTIEGQNGSIDRLELFRDGESTKFAEATKGGCGNDTVPAPGATFCANMENQQLIIPEGEDIDVIVRPRIKSDEQGGVSGELFHIALLGTTSSVYTGAVQARGAESSNDLTKNNGVNGAEGEIFIGTDIPAANSDINLVTTTRNRVTMAKITSITNANPDAHGTAVPAGISNVGQFKIAAAAHQNSNNGNNDVVMDGVVFNVTASNVAVDGSSFKFINKADQTTATNCAPYDANTNQAVSGTVTGNLKVLCDALSSSSVDTEIDEGEDATYMLQMDITDPNTASATGGVATLQVSLQRFDDRSNEVFGIGNDVSHFRWIDEDGSTSTQFLWIEYPETSVKSTSYQS